MSRRTFAIATACAGGFLAFLDTTIVNTAFPGIAASFPDASPAAPLLGAGRLLHRDRRAAGARGRDRRPARAQARLPGRRRRCSSPPRSRARRRPAGRCWSRARALQGAGAAVIMAVSLALILPEYPLARRAARGRAVGRVGGARRRVRAAARRPARRARLALGVRGQRPARRARAALGGRRALDESADPSATGLPDLLGARAHDRRPRRARARDPRGRRRGAGRARAIARRVRRAAVALAATARRCRTHPRPLLDLELCGSRASAARTSGSCCSGWRSSRPSSPTSCSSRASGTTAC